MRNSLRHVTDLAAQALDRSRGLGAIPAAERVYQFRITLLDTRPSIWRRIQVKDCMRGGEPWRGLSIREQKA